MNWRYLAFAVPQILIATAVGGVLLYWEPTLTAFVAFGLGFIVAYIVTIPPLKLLDWFRARRALRARANLSQEADHGYESAWSGWSGSEDTPELLDVPLSEEPGKLRRVLPEPKPGIPVPDKGKRFLR